MNTVPEPMALRRVEGADPAGSGDSIGGRLPPEVPGPGAFCYSAWVGDEISVEPGHAGLCANCRHVRRVQSDRGSVFVRCELALRDARFEKYPRLPVLVCAGYERRDDPPASAEPE